MDRRAFLQIVGAGGLAVPRLASAEAGANPYERTVILVELRGANDGLNTVVPYRDPHYPVLRPRIAIRADDALQLDERTALHPSLEPLLAPWRARELAIVQGLGYPQPNLSHFRSIEIWDTAARSDQYLANGWLARVFAATPVPRTFAADGVVVGSNDMGPLAGLGTRAIALADTEQFLRQSRLAQPAAAKSNPALAHILRTEADIVQAAAGLNGQRPYATVFPNHTFGNVVRTAAQVLAARSNVAVLRLTQSGYDTHQNQPGVHAGLLKQLAEGLVALRAALVELGRWTSTLVMTYSEFGRRAAENGSGGTDHGTANAHFVMGGRVRGGLYGEPPQLARLENGNLPFAVDFRSYYATVVQNWWGIAQPLCAGALGGRFATLDLVKT